MDSRTQERVEQWDSRPFSGGYDGLADLAAGDFSGAVDATGTWLFMLNGRVVGVVDGAIEAFESASGTVYEAPHPSLPLLCAMEERGGETRAKYYTNETPLREVDETLQDGSFTGYIELSENVLSGDYYAVYYGGRRMAAAYIGNSERLLTDDEAFERADDEVGIYEVLTVDIDVTDVPGTDESAADDGSEERTDAGGDAGPTANAPTDAETDASVDAELDEGVDAQPEPSTDPTESAIESIDLSGTDPDTTTTEETTASTVIEDITIDDTDDAADSSPLEETEPLSGITATDDVEPEPTSSGITDAGVETGSETDSASSLGDDRADVDRATSESPAAGSESTERLDDSATSDVELTGPESVSPPDDASEADADPDHDDSGSDEAAAAADADTAGTDGGQTAGVDTEESGPDLAAVEAAAEQLDQNDISWTEDDIESGTEDDAPVDEAESNGPEDPRSQSTAQSEQSTVSEERFEEEEQWREARTIPSIDPDNSETVASQNAAAAGRGGTNQRSRNSRSSESDAATERSDSGSQDASTAAESATGSTRTGRQRQRSTEGTHQQTQRTDRADAGAGTESGDGSTTADADDSGPEHDRRVAELTQRIEALAEQRDALVTKAEELKAERDRFRSENEELSSTVERLQSRVEDLQTELERAREATAGETEADATPDASTQLSPQRALSETNLFVRYASKSQPTLETAHDGQADRDEVASNLRLEHHTGFDAADVAVDGERYEAFLTGTMEHRFVDWLTAMVLYEIRDTGNADALGDLYDAIPRIDRAELGATISLEDDDTEDVPDDVTFDVVAFDKMGNPLVVANLNDSREPATETMLEEMEEAASAVKANYPSLAAATVVTSSYFEPGALEVADQATSSGLLSRGSNLSYVNLSRKQGYHLCLVESRSEGFHMNVPEL